MIDEDCIRDKTKGNAMGHNFQINYLTTAARVQTRYLQSIQEVTAEIIHATSYYSWLVAYKRTPKAETIQSPDAPLHGL